MLIPIVALRRLVAADLAERMKQGQDTDALLNELRAAPESYDSLFDIARRAPAAPMLNDWPYEEPDDLEAIMTATHPDRAKGRVGRRPVDELRGRARAAFFSSVCACVVGKPLEEVPYGTLQDIASALKAVGRYPMNDYITDDMLTAWGRRNPSWVETEKSRIRYVAPDDDITYTLMGMMLLEEKGLNFTKKDIAQMWIEHLPIYTTWGPERAMLLRAGLHSIDPSSAEAPDGWADFLNPGSEYCGALIRADAYGYACPGLPELAARLAWRDASFTHRKTGVYSAMYVAAVIALAFVVDDILDAFDGALAYVPQKSRFFEAASDALKIVRAAPDFESAYDVLHDRFREYGACRVLQEVGTMMNSARFATSLPDGFCRQVSQGNDTDSFGATCGSILGAYYGEDALPARWLAPFRDKVITTMGAFPETSLQALGDRAARLPLLTESIG